MFDSHCHLTDLPSPDAALTEAQAAGVHGVLTCGYDVASNRAVLELVARHPSLPHALGLHPWYASESLETILATLERTAPTAVGEIGLDLWGDPPPVPLDRQREVLEAQLELAGARGLPVSLHSRHAVNELLPVLRNHPRVRGALHAYSGSFEQVRPFLDLGYLVGVGGAVTRTRASRVRRCASALPLDALLLETDAPAIGMDTVEPPGVRPAHLPRVAAVLAELRGLPLEAVVAATDENARRLFGAAAGPGVVPA